MGKVCDRLGNARKESFVSNVLFLLVCFLILILILIVLVVDGGWKYQGILALGNNEVSIII